MNSFFMCNKIFLFKKIKSDPKIIFMDEPTTGMDPKTRRGVW